MTAFTTNRSLLTLTLGLSALLMATLLAQSRADTPVTNTVLYQTQSVLGKDLIASGKKVGRIVDVLADKAGNVQAVVVDCGGFLGIGSRKVAVAWSDLRFSPEGQNALVTDLAEDHLVKAPEVKTGKPVVVVSARNQRPNDVTHN